MQFFTYVIENENPFFTVKKEKKIVCLKRSLPRLLNLLLECPYRQFNQ